MKRVISTIAAIMFAVTLIISVPVNKAFADTTTVSGTIEQGSTNEIIKLKTSQGVMELKLDSNTNYNGYKVFLPGKSLTVEIKYGNDGYWHIATIKSATVVTNVTVDKSNLTAVSGVIKGAASDDVLRFDTSNGEMLIKIDKDTDFSGCSALVVGGSYTIKVGYGSDSYMHAVYVYDGANGYTGSSSSSSNTSNVKAEATVTGNVSSKSTTSLLVLDTAQGEMQIKLDQYNGGLRILIGGQKITVGINYGDGYWHAVSIY